MFWLRKTSILNSLCKITGATGKLRVEEVASLLGVSAGTVRIWGKRESSKRIPIMIEMDAFLSILVLIRR
jgi:hypothetical protein